MKLPQRTPPIQLNDDNQMVRHVVAPSNENGVAPSTDLCDYPGKACGPCNNGSKMCSIPGTRMQFACPC